MFVKKSEFYFLRKLNIFFYLMEVNIMKHLGYSHIIKAKDLRVLARYAAISACIKPIIKQNKYIQINWQKPKSA